MLDSHKRSKTIEIKFSLKAAQKIYDRCLARSNVVVINHEGIVKELRPLLLKYQT